jgi:hypothetical protein
MQRNPHTFLLSSSDGFTVSTWLRRRIKVTNKSLISDQIAWTWVSTPITFLFPFSGLISFSGSLSENADWVSGEADQLGNTWELEWDCENTEVSEGPANKLILMPSACWASADCWALSSAIFQASSSAALWVSTAALWDLRTGADELLASVTLAVAIMECLGLDPDGSWPLLSISVTPKSENFMKLSNV